MKLGAFLELRAIFTLRNCDSTEPAWVPASIFEVPCWRESKFTVVIGWEPKDTWRL